MKEFDRNNNIEIEVLYSRPLPSTRTGALYNAFSYPTKISPETIALFIATHTKPGQVVLDTFGGSGTTGLATLLCDKPTEKMQKMASELGLNPIWGPRQAHLYEVGVLGSFVSQTLCNPPDLDSFTEATKSFFIKADELIRWMYKAKDPEGNYGQIRHVIWSDILICPHCKTETTYWDATVKRNPLTIAKEYNCLTCNKKNDVKKCSRATETILDALSQESLQQKKREPVYIYGQTGRTKWQRAISEEDKNIYNQILEKSLPASAPYKEIVWGDLYRSGYHQGITHLHHFYTRRNFNTLSILWELTNGYSEKIRDVLRLLILSYNASHSTLMTRIVVKKNQKDFVLTGAQSGVLYVSGLPVEKNIIMGLKRKLSVLLRAFNLINGSESRVKVYNSSSELLSLQDDSVDYLFTDPPFGDYIPYAEINQINELWLGEVTDRSKEIIVSRSQGKNINTYEKLMGNVFTEISRVLKSNGYATVVFHSAKSNIWQSLVSAYSKAGLTVRATSVLDKLQSSFKQVVSNVYVKGDPLILLSKGLKSNNNSNDSKKIAKEILKNSISEELAEKEPQRLYSRYISKCLELGVEIKIDAKEFYELAKSSLDQNDRF